MKKFLIKFAERSLSIISYFFPFIEISYYFGAKVFLSIDNIGMRYLYLRIIAPLSSFYEENIYIIFIVMVGIFLVCSRGSVPLTKFLRFNVIQAILLNIICSCIGSIYSFLPLILRETVIGVVLANTFYLGILLIMGYSTILIIYGRYPRIPILSEAAKLQVQRGYQD